MGASGAVDDEQHGFKHGLLNFTSAVAAARSSKSVHPALNCTARKVVISEEPIQNQNVRSDERLAPTNAHPNLADDALEPHQRPANPVPQTTGFAGPGEPG